MPPKAFITGITGQDGSYLSELLIGKGYEVHGLIRDLNGSTTAQLKNWLNHSTPDWQSSLTFHEGDIVDENLIENLILEIEPEEIYNLAAQSHVGKSFEEPLLTEEVNGRGALKVLEAARKLNKKQEVRFYQASSSEMFGHAAVAPQNEDTPFHPRNPYACAKVYAFHQVDSYRDAYGMFACNGILYNHESPRRGENYVTRKITLAAARIEAGLQEKISLGNTQSFRDWGSAEEYVELMWRMLQHNIPYDYVIATNELHTVQDWLEISFGHVGLDWKEHLEIDPRFLRPVETHNLRGDATRAESLLGWKPKTSFKDLVIQMVDADRERIQEMKS